MRSNASIRATADGARERNTETGAYTLLGGTPITSNATTVTRNPGATVFLPSENEWYKAAYYRPGGVYFACAASSATPNTANCFFCVGRVTDVGAYAGSRSHFGIFDQGRNLEE